MLIKREMFKNVLISPSVSIFPPNSQYLSGVDFSFTLHSKNTFSLRIASKTVELINVTGAEKLILL